MWSDWRAQAMLLAEEHAEPPDTDPSLRRQLENLRPTSREFDKLMDDLPMDRGDGTRNRLN